MVRGLGVMRGRYADEVILILGVVRAGRGGNAVGVGLWMRSRAY